MYIDNLNYVFHIIICHCIYEHVFLIFSYILYITCYILSPREERSLRNCRVDKRISNNRWMNYDPSNEGYLRAVVNSARLFPRAHYVYTSVETEYETCNFPRIAGWCMRRYPVIEIRYTGMPSPVSSRHNNARDINSIRKSLLTTYIYRT